MKSLIFLMTSVVVFSMLIPSVLAQQTETVTVFVKYNNGDPADFYEMRFVVFQDFQTTPLLEKNAESNPQKLTLPANHRYQIDVYVNNMYASVGYIDVDKENNVEIPIPLSGGIQINVYYNDGQTPINDATVAIKSHDGTEWRRTQTNEQGDTPRFWLQSTNKESDYYIADIYFGENLIKKFSPIKVQAGLPYDQKVVTNVPKTIEELITITLYKTPNQKLVKDDGEYQVILYDNDDSIAATANVNIRGQAQFSNLKSGEYVAKVSSKQDVDLDLWPETQILLFGQQNEFNIFREQPVTPIDEAPEIESCNCVAFRFDDVQDFWLTDVQISVIEQFTKADIPLTLGLIADSIGNDPKITEFLRQEVKSDKVEVASHGIGNEPFTEFTKEQQKQRLSQSMKLISDKFDVKPKVFIPPQNRVNQDTIDVLIESPITHLSASLVHGEQPPFPLMNQVLYRYPEISTTGEYDAEQNIIVGVDSATVLQKTLSGLDSYGFAVITMHPQEFSTITDGVYTDVVNQQQIIHLNTLIEELQNQGIAIVPITEINLDSNVKIPDWIKNNAGWWADGKIDDNTFVQGIQFLVKEGIIVVQETEQSQQTDTGIPDWIKNNAGWWADGKISGTEFVKGIEYLIANGIIRY